MRFGTLAVRCANRKAGAFFDFFFFSSSWKLAQNGDGVGVARDATRPSIDVSPSFESERALLGLALLSTAINGRQFLEVNASSRIFNLFCS